MIIVTGCAGSGKTMVGQELAKWLGYAYIDKDTVTGGFTDFILERLGSFAGDRESVLYQEEIRPVEYSVTFRLCRELLDCGTNVVLVIPFIGQIQDYSKWEAIRNEIGFQAGTEFLFVWMEHNIETEYENIKSRNAARDVYKLAHWNEYATSVQGISPASEYKAYHCVNDRGTDLTNTVAKLVSKLIYDIGA